MLLGLTDQGCSLLFGLNALGDVEMRHKGVRSAALLQAGDPKLEPALVGLRAVGVVQKELWPSSQDGTNAFDCGCGPLLARTARALTDLGVAPSHKAATRTRRLLAQESATPR